MPTTLTLPIETVFQVQSDQKVDVGLMKAPGLASPACPQQKFQVPPPPGLEPQPPSGSQGNLAATGKAAHTPGGCMNEVTNELIKVVAELARVDEMMQKVQTSHPKAAEAQKWHEISKRALVWSRDALAKKQQGLLEQLRDLTMQQLKPSGVADLAPADAKVAPARVEASPKVAQVLVQERVPSQELEPKGDGSEFVGSLRNHLDKVREYQPSCVVHVRNIKKLGVRSPDKLHEYFSRFGELSDVLVAHSFEKPTARRRQGRVRPAALGFVVFQSAMVAEVLLAGSAEHVVGEDEAAVTIQVQRYEPMDLELLAAKEA